MSSWATVRSVTATWMHGTQDLQSTMVELVSRVLGWCKYRLLHYYHTEVKYWLQVAFCCRCISWKELRKYKTAFMEEQRGDFSPMEISEIELSHESQCGLGDGKHLLWVLRTIKNGKWDIIDTFLLFSGLFIEVRVTLHSAITAFLVLSGIAFLYMTCNRVIFTLDKMLASGRKIYFF